MLCSVQPPGGIELHFDQHACRLPKPLAEQSGQLNWHDKCKQAKRSPPIANLVRQADSPQRQFKCSLCLAFAHEAIVYLLSV